MTRIQEYRRRATVRQNFLREHKNLLPKVAPSGQPLSWEVNVDYYEEQKSRHVHNILTFYKEKKFHTNDACDCGNHYLELILKNDWVERSCFRKCYNCGHEWIESEQCRPQRKERKYTNIYHVDGKQYIVSVRQKAPHHMVDKACYRYDIRTGELIRDSGICWGY